MRKFTWPAILCLLITPVLIYAAEEIPLSLAPENDLISVSGQGELKAVLKSQHTSALHNLKIIGESSLFQVACSPEIVRQLNPAETINIAIQLDLLKEAAQRGSLKFTITSDELGPQIVLAFDVVEGASSNQRLLQIAESFRQASEPIAMSREVVIEIPIETKSSPNLKVYIYGLIILLIIGFFIWRKVRVNAQ